MSHWLDEEEQRNNPERKAAEKANQTNRKKQEVSENYTQIAVSYNAFLEELYNLTERVNRLPMETRSAFGKIDGRSKDSHLNNHLNIFSSSRRISRSSFLKFLSLFGGKRYKNTRVAYIYVSSKPGLVDIEIKELLFLRISRKDDKSAIDPEKANQKLTHFISSVPVEILDHNFALSLIDWFAFKCDSADCKAISYLKKMEV
jgi:hypothetical protein